MLKTYQKDKRLKILDEFVNKDENFKNRYYLSNYRKLGHSTNKREMNRSVFYLKNMKSKFHILKPIIDEIGITSKISQYYARWLEQSKIMQLTRKNEVDIDFLLLSSFDKNTDKLLGNDIFIGQEFYGELKLNNGKYEDVSLYLSPNVSIINLVEMSKDTIEDILSKAQQKIYEDLDSKIQ